MPRAGSTHSVISENIFLTLSERGASSSLAARTPCTSSSPASFWYCTELKSACALRKLAAEESICASTACKLAGDDAEAEGAGCGGAVVCCAPASHRAANAKRVKATIFLNRSIFLLLNSQT